MATTLVEEYRRQCEVAARLGEDPQDVWSLWRHWGVQFDGIDTIPAEALREVEDR
jgi:hypothetical protein